jgi:hypothetical protein
VSKTLFIAGAALVALASPAFAQEFGQRLEAPRESSPKFGTGPVIAPEVGHPPAFGGEPAPKRKAKTSASVKGGVIESPQLSSATQQQETPVQSKGNPAG